MNIKIDVEVVEEKYNQKIMYQSEEIASGNFGGDDKPFRVLQSENRNLITIIVGSYYHHILVNDIILEVLKKNMSISIGEK